MRSCAHYKYYVQSRHTQDDNKQELHSWGCDSEQTIFTITLELSTSHDPPNNNDIIMLCWQ